MQFDIKSASVQLDSKHCARNILRTFSAVFSLNHLRQYFEEEVVNPQIFKKKVVKMKFVKLYVVFLSLVIRSLASDRSPFGLDSLQEFLETQEKKFEVLPANNVTLIMGENLDGKTTLTMLLTDHDFNGLRVSRLTDEYITTDANNRIHRVPKPMQLLPELMFDKNHTAAYYDWTSFDKLRRLNYQMLVSHLVKKLTKHGNAVKFVFVVPQTALLKYISSPFAFLDIANYVTSMIKDIEKYRNSIAMVVTKVEKDHSSNTIPHQSNDEKAISEAAEFLREKRQKISKYVEDSKRPSAYDYKKILRFIDILLTKEGDSYERIKVLAKPDRDGSVMNIPTLQANKIAIKSMINDHLSFVKTAESDFEYAISKRCKEEIYNMTTELFHLFEADIAKIGEDIKGFYIRLEKMQLVDMYSLVSPDLEKFETLTSSRPHIFFTRLYTVLNSLKIPTSNEDTNMVNAHFKALQFLNNIHARLPTSIDISDGLKDLKNYLEELKIWYGFIDELSEILSYVNLKQKESQIYQLMDELSIKENEMKNIDETSLRQFLDDIDDDIYKDVEDMQVNSYKLNALKIVLKKATNFN